MRNIDITSRAFNTKQTAAIVGATERQLAHWDRKGLVKPSLAPASGKGSRRLYSYKDLIALRTVLEFRDEGISLQKIRKSVLYLRNHLRDVSQPLGFCLLITDGETVYLVVDESTLKDTVRREGQHVFFHLSIAGLEHELRNRVLSLAEKRLESVTVGDCTYQVELEADDESGGYVADVAGLPGCVTQGDTVEEALEMARDAIESWESAAGEIEAEGQTVQRGRKTSRRRRA